MAEDVGGVVVVNAAELPRWGNSYCPGYAQLPPLIPPIVAPRPSPFPFRQDINLRIAYWVGDVSTLNTRAVVCCNNEALTDRDPLTLALLQRAGPSLRRELTHAVKFCRTGEARITKAYELPARHVIHTVGPRYDARYRTAADNALYNCYRNTLLLTQRGYPSQEGAHIALSQSLCDWLLSHPISGTVRRFLENCSSDALDLIVLAVSGEDREAYNALLPLYFPRTSDEELHAAQRLPADVGNLFGEPVIAERTIRISANPAGGGVEGDGEEEGEGGEEGTNLRELFNSSVSIGEHAFARMEGDVDLRRTRGGGGGGGRQGDEEEGQPPPPPEDRNARYARMLRRAKQENFTELNARRFLYQSGFDRENRPVILFIAKRFPANRVSRDKAALYFIRQLDALVSGQYVLVYVHTLSESVNEPSSLCLKNLLTMLDERYTANLEALYMIHASLWAKATLWWFCTFHAPEVKGRVEYLPGVEHLFALIDLDQLDLPDFVMQYDVKVNGTRYYNAPEQTAVVTPAQPVEEGGLKGLGVEPL